MTQAQVEEWKRSLIEQALDASNVKVENEEFEADNEDEENSDVEGPGAMGLLQKCSRCGNYLSKCFCWYYDDSSDDEKNMHHIYRSDDEEPRCPRCEREVYSEGEEDIPEKKEDYRILCRRCTRRKKYPHYPWLCDYVRCEEDCTHYKLEMIRLEKKRSRNI